MFHNSFFSLQQVHIIVNGEVYSMTYDLMTLTKRKNFWIWIWIFSRQGPQTRASHRRAVVCEQLAQGCYLRVQWLWIEPTTLRSLGLTRQPLDYQATPRQKLLSVRSELTLDFIISSGSYRLTAVRPMQRCEPAIFQLSCAI